LNIPTHTFIPGLLCDFFMDIDLHFSLGHSRMGVLQNIIHSKYLGLLQAIQSTPLTIMQREVSARKVVITNNFIQSAKGKRKLSSES
jgi:hypothetical protein